MVKKIIYGVSALLVTVIVLCFIFCRESEEEKIIRTLKEFCADAAKNKDNSGPAAVLLKTNVLKAYFSENCELSIQRGLLYGKYSDVRAANEIMRLNLFFRETELDVSDIFVTVDSAEASVLLTGTFYGVLKDGSAVEEVCEVELVMRKDEKKWRMSSVEVHKILEK